MKVTIKTVNENGLKQIEGFLIKNHKNQPESIDRSALLAWAAEAEFQLGEGNTPTIELKSYQHRLGFTEEFTIGNEGLDCEEIEIEE